MTEISRRTFLAGTGVGLAGVAALPSVELTVAAAPAPSPAVTAASASRSAIVLRVNGREHRLEVEDRWTLAEVLRDHLGLTGTKIGCDRGECGACTVHLGGRTIYACSYLAVWANGQSITTVEGLAGGDTLDPLQHAFIEHDGPQCGFCTSGQLMSAKALLAATPHPTASQVREALAGNLCRCSNYNREVEAVLAAAGKSSDK